MHKDLAFVTNQKHKETKQSKVYFKIFAHEIQKICEDILFSE